MTSLALHSAPIPKKPLPQNSSNAPITAQLVEGPHVLLDSFTEEWDSLVARPSLDEPFLRPYWFIAFARAFNNGDPISLFTAREERELVGVLPMRRSQKFFGRIPGRTFSSLAGIHSCRFDLICEPSKRDAVSNAIWERLKGRDDWDVIEAEFVPLDGAFSHILHHAERDGYLTAIWPTQKSPYLTLPEPGSPPLQNCPPRYADARKRLGRYERRLKDRGEPTFETITTFTESLFEDFLEMEGSGWKGKAGSAIKCSPTTTQFYREASRDASDYGQFRMCVLSVDGRKIAMELALTGGSSCFSPKVAYDETFSNTSPGALLVQRIITDLTRHGFTRYDLLGSQGRHKAMWAGEVREHASMYVIRPNLLGRFHHLLLGSIAPRMRALRHRVYGDPQSLQPRRKKPSA